MGKSWNKAGKFLLPHLTLCTSTIARDGAGLGVGGGFPFSQQQFTWCDITASQHPLTAKQR